MNFIFIDLEILNSDLLGFSNTNFYSNIIFKNQTFLERLKDSLDLKFNFEVRNLNDLEIEDEFIIWTSNIVFLDKAQQTLFLEKLYHSRGSFRWSKGSGFIFKGTKNDFSNKQYIELELEDFLVGINDFHSFHNLLETSIDTRHFNEIEKSKNTYTKKSEDIGKIEGEFKFLSTLPPKLKPFFIKVHSYKETDGKSQYSMPRINYLDISRRHINGELTKEDVEILFGKLEIYFEKLIEVEFQKTGKEFDFISDKTKKRVNSFKGLSLFKDINSLFKLSPDYKSLDEVFERLNLYLEKNKRNINKKGSVITHGDLCFSNILSSKDFRELIFIDPMGGTIEESIKSIYYDFAKLSHSILGNYDLIIHGLADLEFNNDMELFISFKKERNIELEENFLTLLEKFNLDIGITRLVEASLFLSMLPLHAENYKRSSMLAFRGSEILTELIKGKLI